MPVLCGDTKLQPVYVGDVADAVMAALRLPATAPRIYELGGPDIWTFRDILVWILHQTERHRRLFEVPMGLAKLQASVLEKLPGKLLTNDQLLLLARDNIVSPGMPGLAELGLVPTPVDLVVPAYLDRYRQGGRKREMPPAPDDEAASDLFPRVSA
jgi:NADH dehydrogenase